MDTTLSALLGRVRGARGPPTTAAAPDGGFFGSFMFDRPGWASSIKGSEQRERERDTLLAAAIIKAGEFTYMQGQI